MKTAISIPDNLFKVAEETAKKYGISRSNLFTKAIEEFIKNHNPQDITNILNNIYETQDSNIDEDILEMQINSINQEDW
jgi:metal-responsive CopG/Arc/MetJ family transcriptional regulator